MRGKGRDGDLDPPTIYWNDNTSVKLAAQTRLLL